MTAYTHLNETTVTVGNEDLTGVTISWKEYGDGSIEFTDTDGNVWNVHSNEALQKFAELVQTDLTAA